MDNPGPNNKKQEDFLESITGNGFGLGMLMLSGIFWVISLIPVLGAISDIFYWILWAIFYFAKFRKNLTARKITMMLIVVGICFILDLIPVVNFIPWLIFGTWITRKIVEKQ